MSTRELAEPPEAPRTSADIARDMGARQHAEETKRPYPVAVLDIALEEAREEVDEAANALAQFVAEHHDIFEERDALAAVLRAAETDRVTVKKAISYELGYDILPRGYFAQAEEVAS